MTESRDDGGPAFARSIGYGTLLVGGHEGNLEVGPQAGMSLRDYFAGQALAGHIALEGSDRWGHGHWDVAAFCYALADAMLVERKK